MIASESGRFNTDKGIKLEVPSPQLPEEAITQLPLSPSSQQNLVFSLALSELRHSSMKSCGSLNMDDFLNSNVWDAEGNQSLTQSNQNKSTDNKGLASQPPVSEQESLSIPTQLGKKMIDEVWYEINKDEPGQEKYSGVNGQEQAQHQHTFGEMTLEDFLIKAGVVQGTSSPLQNSYRNFPSSTAGLEMNFGLEALMGSGFSNHPDIALNNLSSNSFIMAHVTTPSGILIGESSEYGESGIAQNPSGPGGLKNKRRGKEGASEKAVERRHRRMIKNRESAARSRARKQAYTVELEFELNQLREENEKLKQTLAEAEEKPMEELMKVKQSTNADKLAEKLKKLRRTNSLAW